MLPKTSEFTNIDLMLANKTKPFLRYVIKTKLLQFFQVMLATIKTYFPKELPNIGEYTYFKIIK